MKFRFSRYCAAAAKRLTATGFLRVSLGREPDPAEVSDFIVGYDRHAADMPPLFTGLFAVAQGREKLFGAASYLWHWQRSRQQIEDFGGVPDLDGNIFTAWTGPAVSFMHIEKCGGISVLQWLSRLFHPEQISPDPSRDCPPHLYARALPGLDDDARRYPLIWGHYDLPSLRRLDPDRFSFTILREPKARLVSLYHYWRSVDPAKFDPEVSFALTLAHRLSLEDFLNCDDPLVIDSIDNLYVRRLTGLYATGAGEDPLVAKPEAALRSAAKALTTLDFVGFTEHLDETLKGLATRLGVAPPAAAMQANVTSKNHTDPSGWFREAANTGHTCEVSAALQRRTRVDSVLYQQALAAFKSNEAGLPGQMAAE